MASNALERIRPESRNRRRAGKHRRHADDGDVGRFRRLLDRVLGQPARARTPGRRDRALALAELVMQLGDRGGLAAERGDLAEHVEAVGRLVLVADWLRAASLRPLLAIDALGRDPQPADVQALEGLADFLGRAPLGQEASSLFLEAGDERRRADADLVARP